MTDSTTRSIADVSASTGPVVLGTRGSALALWQAESVRARLAAAHPGLDVELRVIKPEGDLDKHSSLLQIGGRGVFASALQEALLAGLIDLAVHSTKDVPTIEPAGLVLAAFPEREDARDVIVSRHGVSLAELPRAPVIGTSSRRRAVQVLALRPDAVIADLRGNIDTRLRKAASSDYDAIVLAAAGLTRMGWGERVSEYLPVESFVPSPGQGALAVETRQSPDPVHALVAAIDDPAISTAVTLERAFLRAIGGGCTTPVGAHVTVEGTDVLVRAMLASDDGTRIMHVQETFPVADAQDGIATLATRMMAGLAPTWSGADTARSPLAGRQVLVTGTPETAIRIGDAFTADGAIVRSAPTLIVHPSDDPEALDRALQRLASGGYDWLVVTSRQTVPSLIGLPVEALVSTRVIAVGTATAEALAAAGIVVDMVPAAQTSSGVVEVIEPLEMTGQRVLCLLGDRAGTPITDALAAKGALVDRVESYRTEGAPGLSAEARAAVRAGEIDIAVFPSPSSARTLVELLGADLAALSGACLAAIGPTTAAGMTGLGLPVHVEAPQPSAEAIVASCREYFGAREATGELGDGGS